MDNQYILGYGRCGCSGFKSQMYFSYKIVFDDNMGLFTSIYRIHNYIFSHAGITSQWASDFCNENQINPIDFNLDTLHEYYRNPTTNLLFSVSKKRGGSSLHGGPFWADKSEFYIKDSLLPAYHQIVGHSRVDQITTISDESIDASVTFIDVLENEKTDKIFYEITID